MQNEEQVVNDISPHDAQHETVAPPSLADAAEANMRTGMLLLCKEALITAIQDRRLERGHLRVLAAMAMFMNSRSAKAWPSRAAVAEKAGMSVKTVSNTLLELRNLGYLIADRVPVEESGGRRLTVYTFGNIDHETIRQEITEFCRKMREQREADATPKSPPTGNVPAHGERKSPPTGDSNSKKELNKKEAADAPVQLQDLIWTKGIEYLRGCYAGSIAEERLRNRLGRMIQQHGSGNVLDAISKAQRNGTTVDPLPYMEAVLRGASKSGQGRPVKLSRW